MDKEQLKVKEVSIKDLWAVFTRCWWIMLLVAVALTAGSYTYAYFNYSPIYKSTSIIYILARSEDSTSKPTTGNFSLSMNLVNDCNYLLKSHAVLDEVIKDLNLDLSYGQLRGSISTNNPDGTRVLEVTVRNASPTEAKRIVDKLSDVGAKRITAVMGLDQLNTFDYGTMEYSPINRLTYTRYVLIGLIGALLIYVVFILFFILDDRVHDEEDIENMLGMTVLGVIPDANVRRRRYYYNKSRYYNRKMKEQQDRYAYKSKEE